MVDLKQPRLSGLGRNPAAPAEFLVRLATHAAGRHGLALRKGQLPDAVVEALLTYGGSDSAVLLHGHRVSPAMRLRIAEHPDPAIRNAHADFGRTAVELRASLGIDALVEAYGRPPAELVAASDPRLRAMVADVWWDRPMAAQVALLSDPDPAVQAAAVRHERPGIPPEHYDRCLANPATRAAAAGRVPLTPDQFARLTATGDEAVVRAVARNPHLTADMVDQLQDNPDPFVRVAVAYSRHVTALTRDRLLALVEAEKAAGDDGAWIALDWSDLAPSWVREAPLAERLLLLDCPHATFRRALASSRDLSDEAWQRLDDDADVSVRRVAARRPDTPPQVLLRLVRAHGDVSHVWPMLVDHPNFPRQALRGLAEEPDPRVRVLALKDPDLPVPQLWRLAESDEEFLRAGAAGHPNATIELLERLLADPAPKVAEASAANPVLPRTRMSLILTEAGL